MPKTPRVPGNAEYEALAKSTLDRLGRLNRRLASGKVDLDGWQDGFHTILFDGHTDAWVLGRRRAGVPGKRDEDDERFGLDAADGQEKYLSRFAKALKDKDPRYFDADGNFRLDQIGDRTALYVARMRGTANEAFVEASEDDDEFDWILGPHEHCADCVELAALSPYTKATMISHPGDGQTICLGNCGCRLVRRRGNLSGFDRPDVYRGASMDPLSRDLFAEPATIADEPDADELARVTEALFGRDVTSAGIARLSGAPTGSLVSIDTTESEVQVAVRNADLELILKRRYTKDGDGLTVARHERTDIRNAPSGTGSRVLAREVAESIALGIDRIELLGAGSPTDARYNGYYTWPRLGFNARLRTRTQFRARSAGYDATDLNRLMLYGDEAAKWWRANGYETEMVFDLKDGALARSILRNYLASNRIEI